MDNLRPQHYGSITSLYSSNLTANSQADLIPREENGGKIGKNSYNISSSDLNNYENFENPENSGKIPGKDDVPGETRRLSRFKVILVAEASENPGNERKYEIDIPLEFIRETGSQKDIKNNSENSGKTADGDNKFKVWFSLYGGMAMTLFAGLNFTTASVFAKLLNQSYQFNSYSTTFWRYFGVLIAGLPLFIYFQFFSKRDANEKSPASAVWPPTSKQRLLNILGLLIRGTLGTAAVVFRYYAIEYIKIGDMNVISYSTPILVTVLAHFFLGEKCGVVPIIVAFIALSGVFVIIRPPLLTGEDEFDQNALIGTGLAAGSLVCGALIIIVTRKIRKVHFSVMTLAFGIIGVVGGYSLTLTKPSTHPFRYPTSGELNEVLYVVGIGTVSFIGQMAIIIATQFEQAGPVALLRSNDVILGFIFGYIIFDETVDQFSGIGGTIVLSMILLMGVRKWLSTLPEDHPKRKTFSLLLR